MRIPFCILSVLLSSATSLSAAPGDIYVTFYGARNSYPYIDNAGVIHAFMCISLGVAEGPREECYGFYPHVSSVAEIYLSNNGRIVRSGNSWTETPGPFHFVQQGASKGRITLFDASRSLSWILSVPVGGSTVSWPGVSQPWYDVTGVRYDPLGAGSLGGPGIASEFNESPSRFATVQVSFTRKITVEQRSAIYAAMNVWNGRHYSLTSSNCIDFVDSELALIGANRPPRGSFQTPFEYVQALVQLNP